MWLSTRVRPSRSNKNPRLIRYRDGHEVYKPRTRCSCLDRSFCIIPDGAGQFGAYGTLGLRTAYYDDDECDRIRDERLACVGSKIWRIDTISMPKTSPLMVKGKVWQSVAEEPV